MTRACSVQLPCGRDLPREPLSVADTECTHGCTPSPGDPCNGVSVHPVAARNTSSGRGTEPVQIGHDPCNFRAPSVQRTERGMVWRECVRMIDARACVAHAPAGHRRNRAASSHDFSQNIRNVCAFYTQTSQSRS